MVRVSPLADGEIFLQSGRAVHGTFCAVPDDAAGAAGTANIDIRVNADTTCTDPAGSGVYNGIIGDGQAGGSIVGFRRSHIELYPITVRAAAGGQAAALTARERVGWWP